ncbi:hypothetical protein ACVCNR_03325 [Aquamicrobium terrae]
MGELDGTAFPYWHLLFDELCNRAGYYDDATLASAYCALTASKGQRQFETAMRNLNNWRSGRHLPRPGNLRVLAKLLNVADDPATQDLWNRLYREAGDIDHKVRSGLPAPVAPYPAPRGGLLPAIVHPMPAPFRQPALLGSERFGRKRFSALQAALGGIVLLAIGATAGSLVTASGWRPWAGPADDAPIIPFRPVVAMKLGESRPIYAERSDCGKLPRDWELVESDLPVLRTGTFSDGGLARRFSKFCQGLTPARAIVFTATATGVEEFEIQGDFFKMTVTD